MKLFFMTLCGQSPLQETEKALETGDGRFEFVTRHADKLIFVLV